VRRPGRWESLAGRLASAMGACVYCYAVGRLMVAEIREPDGIDCDGALLAHGRDAGREGAFRHCVENFVSIDERLVFAHIKYDGPFARRPGWARGVGSVEELELRLAAAGGGE